MVNSTNILCCELSNVLYEIVEASFCKRSAIKVFGNYDSLKALELDVKEQPHVIITESKQSSICPDILYQYPQSKVVIIEKHGRSIAVWRLQPCKQNLGEITSDELAKVVLSSNEIAH